MREPQDLDVRGDFSAHDHAMSLPMGAVVRELVDLLGATTVAALGGVSETRAVQQWMSDREPQRGHVLRFSLQIASMIATSQSRDVARAWFHGLNPRLGDRAPLFLLRDRPLAEVQGQLIGAARAFAARDGIRHDPS